MDIAVSRVTLMTEKSLINAPVAKHLSICPFSNKSVISVKENSNENCNVSISLEFLDAVASLELAYVSQSVKHF